MQTCYWKLQKTETELAEDYKEIIEKAAEFIRAGEVVAFPTETVYGLGANGLNGEAVDKIFKAKGRPNDNPLILHIADIKDIEPLTTGLNANAKALAEAFWPGPLTLIVDKAAIVPNEVSAGLSTVAVRFPGNKFAQDFIKACGCPIAAPSANISGRPSPTNGKDVWEDMQGKVAAILDGGSCGIGLESTIVDTTEALPTILRPGGITYEMLTEVLGAVEIDKGLKDANFKPKAPGMKYRHYAPKAPMYLLEGDSRELLPEFVHRALLEGKKVGVLCSDELAMKLEMLISEGLSKQDEQRCANLKLAEELEDNLCLSVWGANEEQLAADLFYLLRDFDRTKPDIIIAEGVEETGIGLAIMNRMRKAAGQQCVTLERGLIKIKNVAQIPSFMVQ